MPATCKSELIAVTQREFDKLMTLASPLEAEGAMQKDADGVSIKDVVAHRAHWIRLYLGWYADGQAGKPVYFPAQGYKWNDLKRYNAALRVRQADLTWPAAKDLLKTRHAELTDFIASKTQAELYGGPMKGANNSWTPGRWAEAAGPSHYRSAAKFLRAEIRAGQASERAGF